MKCAQIVLAVIFAALFARAAEVPPARVYTAAGELVVPAAADGKLAKVRANPSAARLSERTECTVKRGRAVQVGSLGARMTEKPARKYTRYVVEFGPSGVILVEFGM